jgi:hypothetical protein
VPAAGATGLAPRRPDHAGPEVSKPLAKLSALAYGVQRLL